MTITTKFDIEDYVYIIHKNKVEEVKIHNIIIYVEMISSGKIFIDYLIKKPNEIENEVRENTLYRTKKEAIRDMIKQSGYKISEDDLIEI